MPAAPFVAHLDVTKALIAIVLTALMAAGGLVFAWNARTNAQSAGWNSDTLVPLGVGVALFFVMATVSFKSYTTYQKGRSGPIVRIDQNGIFDARLGPKTIPWEAIRGAEIVDVSNAKITGTAENMNSTPKVMEVQLTVTNAAEYMGNNGVLETAAKGLSAATGYDRINLRADGLDTRPEAILNAVQSRMINVQP